jgi:hypothetical protein
MASKLSALRTGSFLPPGRFLVLIFVRGLVNPGATVRLEGLGKFKMSNSSGTQKPATFRLTHTYVDILNAGSTKYTPLQKAEHKRRVTAHVQLLETIFSRVRSSAVTNSNGFWTGWLDLLTPYAINSYLQALQRYCWFNNLQFIVTLALGFSFFTIRILVTEIKCSPCD